MIEETIKANTEALRDMIDILCKLKISQDAIAQADPRQLEIEFNKEETKPEEKQKPIPHPTS